MKGIVINRDQIILEISKNELATFASALVEVCNEIENWEFETRIGIHKEDAKKFLEFLMNVYAKFDEN